MVCVNGYREKIAYKYDGEGRLLRREEHTSGRSQIENYRYNEHGQEVFYEIILKGNTYPVMHGTRVVTEYIDEENKIKTSEYYKEDSVEYIVEIEDGWKLEELGEKQLNDEKQLLTATFWSPYNEWSRRYTYTYTEEGKPLAIDIVQRERDATEFHPWRNVEWTYGKNSGTVLEKEWIGEAEGMRNDRKYDFKLDEHGDTLSTTEYHWSPGSGKWEGYDKSEYKYDEQHRMVEYRCYEPGRLSWIEICRNEYQYGQYGIERDIYYFLHEGYMEASDVTLYYYDDSGQLELWEKYVLDRDINDFYLYSHQRYYYGQSGIAAPVVASPAVRASGLTLELGEAQQVSVYSVGGRLVYSGWSASVDLPAPGLYLVRTSDGCAKVLAR